MGDGGRWILVMLGEGCFPLERAYWHSGISMFILGAPLHQSTKVRLFHTLLDFKASVREQPGCALSVCSVSLLLIPHWKGTSVTGCISPF